MAVAGKAGVRRLLATGLVVAVMLGLVPALPRPSPAAAQSQPAIAPQKDPAPKPSEEIVERRTKASKTFATDTPGRFTTKVFDQAVHYPGADGRWDDIDTTLVERGQGRFHTKGSPVEVDVAPNPDDPELARVNLDARHAIGFGMRGASRGTARPDKATMAHRGIRPGTDLELTAHPQGLKEDIVLTSGQAPDTFVFPLKLKGLTAALDSATGDVTYSDEAGTERARTPRGFMTDSAKDPNSDEAASSDGVTYRLIPDGPRGLALEVSLDRAWLEDPARVYPVRVDPTFFRSDAPEDDTFVMSPYNRDNAFDADLKVGTFNGGGNKARSYMNFDVGPLNGKIIHWATFWAYNYHSYSCSPRGMGVYRVTQGWNGHYMRTWPGAWLGERVAWANFAAGYERGGCGDNWAGFDMAWAVRNWTSGAWPQFGLAMVADNEWDSYAWKKFGSTNWASGLGGNPHIDIGWSENHPPNIPDLPDPPNGAYFVDSPPTLSARYTDPDGNGGNVDFEIYGISFTPVGTSNGQRAYYRPSLGHGTYYWRLRAWDGSLVSPWGPWRAFTIGPNRPPNIPDQMEPPDRSMSTSAPTLSARYTDPDGNGGNVDFDIEGVSFTPVGTSNGRRAYYRPPLGEGTYRWRVRAWDGSLVSEFSPYRSFTIDNSPPAAPAVSSSTHPDQARWYANNTPAFSWSASDTSGIAGYSHAFDQSPTTDADTASEGTPTSWTAPASTDGTWYFHVRAQNGLGAWGATAHHKVQIDTGSPAAPSVSSSTHPDQARWYADNTPAFSWSASGTSGIAGYSHAFDQSPATDPDTTSEGTATTWTAPASTDGTWYFHVRAQNGAGAWGVTAHHRVNLDITNPTQPPAVASTTHLPTVATSNRTATVTWQPGSDATSGVAGYSWAFNDSPTTPTDAIADGDASVRSATSPALADGLWWFHVRTLDAAGNASADKVYGPMVVDQNGPLALAPTLLPEPVAQSDELGLEQFFPMGSYDLGTAAGYVHLRSGNAVVQHDDVTVPAQGLNAVVKRTYNSQDSTNADGLGRGWRLSVADLDAGLDGPLSTATDLDATAGLAVADLFELVNGVRQVTGQLVEFSDGDGTSHRFVRRGGPGSRWDAPPGVNLRLVEVRDPVTGATVAYDFVRPDGVTYRGENVKLLLGLPSTTWRITQVSDRNDNRLDYAYTLAGVAQVRLSEVRHNRRPGEVLVRLAYDVAGNLDYLDVLPGVSAPDPFDGQAKDWTRRFDFTVVPAVGLTDATEGAHLPAGHPERRTTRYDYNPVDKTMTGLTDARGHTTRFRHELSLPEGLGAPVPRLRFLDDRRAKTWEWRYGAAAGGTQTTTALSPLGAATDYTISTRGPVSEADRRIAGGNTTRILDAGNNAGRVRTDLAWSANRVASMTDGVGATRAYRYDSLGNVTKVTLPSPNVANPPADLPQAVNAPVENQLSYTYLSPGGADATCDPAAAPPDPNIGPEGYCATVSEMDRVARATNHAGQLRITDFDYNAAGELTQAIQRKTPDLAAPHDAGPSSDDRATTFTYHPGGLLASTDGPRADVADVTRYDDYDRTGQAGRITDAANKAATYAFTPYGTQGRGTDRNGHLTRSRYDSSDNLLARVDAEGHTTTWAYDANHNQTAVTSPKGNASALAGDFTTTFAFDPTDAEVDRAEPGPTPGPPTRLTHVDYNDEGTPARLAAPNGGVVELSYWPNRSVRTERAKLNPTEWAVTDRDYDAAGREALTTGPVTNAAGARPQSRVTYTPQGNQAAVTQTSSSGALDRTLNYAYDAHGDRIQELLARVVGGTRAEARHDYDTFAQPTATHRRKGPGPVGADAVWLDSTISYDAAGNKATTTQESGDGVDLAARYRYDALGRLAAQVADPAEPTHEVHYAYDGEGRQTTRVDKAQMSGDPAAACGDAGVTCTDQRSTTMAYNPTGRLRSQVSRDHASGQTMAECNYAEAAPDPAASGYDPDGHRLLTRSLTGTTDCNGGTTQRSQSMTWGHQGWLGSTTQSVRSPASGAMVSREQGFDYDAVGKLSRATHDGRSISYVHTLAGRMEAVTDWRGWRTSVGHFASGNRRSMTLGAHDATQVATAGFDYHPSAETKAAEWSTSAGVVRSHANVAYDTDGMRRGEDVAVIHPAGSPGDPGGRAEFDYDLLGRLKSWTSPFSAGGGAEERPRSTYDLDDAGNIETETTTTGGASSSVTSTYEFNRLKSRTTSAGNTTFAQNTLGEETTRTGAGARDSTYDPAGHTAQVSDATSTVDYNYDTANRLLSRTGSGPSGDTRVQFYWGETNSLAEEADGTGATNLRYVVDSAFSALGTEGKTGWTWHLPDVEGNVATLVGDDGAVKEQKAYAPYGAADANGTRGQPTDPAQARTRLGFQGAQTDDKTGNVLLGPRQYDPTTAKFTTPDTFVAGDLDLELGLDPLTGNRYLFAGANPTMFYENGHGFCPFGHNNDDDDSGCKGGSAKKALKNPVVRTAGAAAAAAVVCAGTAGWGCPAAATAAASVAANVGNHHFNKPKEEHSAGGYAKAVGQGLAEGAPVGKGVSAGRGVAKAAGGRAAKAARGGAGPPNRIHSARELMRRAEDPGPYHNFPDSFDHGIFEHGTRTVVPGYYNKGKPLLSNDSVQYRMPGSINGTEGMYEIFARPSLSGRTEVMMHRFFRPSG